MVPDQLARTGWVELLLWMLGLRRRVAVVGQSMKPTIDEGDELLIAQRKSVRVGDIVVLEHPRDSDTVILKRVKRLDEGGVVWIEGDNPDESTDSRQFGQVRRSELTGVVSSRLKKKLRKQSGSLE